MPVFAVDGNTSETPGLYEIESILNCRGKQANECRRNFSVIVHGMEEPEASERDEVDQMQLY